MSRIINVRITDEEDDKIQASGMSYSEYVRRAIDYYDVDMYNQILLEFMRFCKDNVKNCKDDVKNIFTSEKKKPSERLKNGDCKENLYKNKENLYKNKENLYKNKENEATLIKTPDENIKQKLAPELERIRTVLQQSENKGVLPNHYIELLMKRCGLSKDAINNYVREHYEELTN